MVAKVNVVFLVLGYLVLSGTAYATTEPQAKLLAQVQEEAKQGNYRLMAPATIKAQFLKNPTSLFLVDTRQEYEYQPEHIKGAVNLPITPTWWTQYSPWARSEMKKLLGPDKERQVVFY